MPATIGLSARTRNPRELDLSDLAAVRGVIFGSSAGTVSVEIRTRRRRPRRVRLRRFGCGCSAGPGTTAFRSRSEREPIRIALFTDTYLPTVDGVVTSVLTTRRQLEANGHEVVVFAPEDSKRPQPREDGTIYVRAKEFRSYPGYRLAMFPGRETDLVKELDIDVIHIHGVGFVGIKGLWASWHARIPRVSTFHTMIQDTLPFYSPFGLNLHLLERGLRFYLRIFLRKTQGVVVPSRAVLNEILELSPRARIADVIPTGVDPARFHPGVSGRSIRNKWGLNGHDVILHVGRVAPEKNLATLIRAFPYVQETNPDAKLLVVGAGPYLEKYYDMVRNEDLSGDVIFTGFVPDADLPKYYAAADAFAIASKFETQGLVILEALASGLPVAGANFRAIPEFVREGLNGHLFEPGDARGAANSILRCLASRDALGASARVTALPFTVAACTRRLEGVYERLVAA
jgi:1,2-diacylglycerol 3-alpha-glucosyltransferase